MRVVYSDRFKPHTKHVLEVLQLIKDGRDKLQTLNVKTRLNPNNLIDYLAFARLTDLIEVHGESTARGFSGNQIPTFEDLARYTRYTFTVTALGQKLLQAYRNWDAVFTSPADYSDSQIIQARQDWEAACTSVRERPDLIKGRLAPKGFSISVLHPEF
jgi:hypothetical protein